MLIAATVAFVCVGSEWQVYMDENGYQYYYNQYTGESTYDPPATF